MTTYLPGEINTDARGEETIFVTEEQNSPHKHYRVWNEDLFSQTAISLTGGIKPLIRTYIGLNGTYVEAAAIKVDEINHDRATFEDLDALLLERRGE